MGFSLILMSFWGGILSTTTPCNLIAIPSFASYIISDSNSLRRGFFLTLAYSIGFCTIFTLIGVALLFIPGFILAQTWIQVIGGAIIVIFGFLMLFGIIKQKINNNEVEAPTKEDQKNSKDNLKKSIPTYFKSYILGLSLGTSGFSCVLPIFIPVLTTIVIEANIFYGILYIFFYSFGIILPYFILGVSLGKLNEVLILKLIKIGSKLQRVFGAVIIILGYLYMRTGLILLGVISP